MTVMSSFYGLEGFVPYEPKDITNLRHSFRTADQEYDIEETIAYFMELKEKDPGFFYKVSKDEENRVENIFWVDSAARKAYAEAYHDCVSFDTTFMTNHLNMPFAPFIGINRHGQSFMLGCGFTRDEREEAFKWMFEAFLEAMDGRQPDNIITDQDRAMANAIAAVFPDTVHRNCRWHIMKKANEKLGPYLGRHPGLAEDFNEVVDESMSPEEFGARWAEMVEKWDLRGHETFAWLKKYAHTWVPCYFRDRFFPFLQSTQRSEGFNSVLKRYVNPQNSLKHFVKQYEKIQQRMLYREGHNDFDTDELVLDPSTSFPIEKHAMAVYTRPIYRRFVLEFEMIGRYNVQPQGQNMYMCVPNNLRCYPYGARSYLVNANGGAFSCECCKIERDRILCCHVLKIFTHLGVDAISERYINRRWTQDALSFVVMPGVAGQKDVMPEESREHIRFANLSRDFVGIAKLGCKSDQAEAIAKRHIREMRTEFAQLNKVRRKKASKSNNQNAAPSSHSGPAPVASQQTECRSNQSSRSVPNMPQSATTPRMAQPTGPTQPTTSIPNVPQTATAACMAQPTWPSQTTISVPSVHQSTNAARMAQPAGASEPSLSIPRMPRPAPKTQKRPTTGHVSLSATTSICDADLHLIYHISPTQNMPSFSGQTHDSVANHLAGPSGGHSDIPGTFSTPVVPCTDGGQDVRRHHAKRLLFEASTVQIAEPMVILNPPRSNTKGRKKGRYMAGIELQAKRINLCGTCGQPGHNSATCTAGLGHNKPDGSV
ncbi:unnamed protein product [Alopecurus aequalis]